MKTNVELITPAISTELLLHNMMNRNIKPATVLEYARLMAAGLWKEATGESIKISTEGFLIDGQQRLNALIKANMSLKFLVVRDVDSEVFKVIDQGVKRTPSDVFHIAGVTESTLTSSGIRRYSNLLRGLKLSYGAKCLSNAEIFSLYLIRPKFWNAAAQMAVGWYSKNRILSKADYCGLYALFFEIDNDDAFFFIDSLARGVNLSPNDPIMLLREKLIGNLIRGYRLTEVHRTALIYKAWNYYRKGMKVNRLNIIKDEAFPIPA